MYALAYISKAHESLHRRDARHALRNQAQLHNLRQGITGLLIYAGGEFVQLLEGEKATVQALAARIAGDPRHTDMQVLAEAEIAARAYAYWSMALLDIESVTAESRGHILTAIAQLRHGGSLSPIQALEAIIALPR